MTAGADQRATFLPHARQPSATAAATAGSWEAARELRQHVGEAGDRVDARVGGSLAEFARRHGIAPARLYWWRRRLETEPADLTTLSLVPATVTTASAAMAAITIRLPNGIAIEATSATPAWIAAVVTELSRST